MMASQDRNRACL